MIRGGVPPPWARQHLNGQDHEMSRMPLRQSARHEVLRPVRIEAGPGLRGVRDGEPARVQVLWRVRQPSDASDGRFSEARSGQAGG